jgi:ABC-type nitrate/sulfonate/bicarbonate transport system ATPase subunit
MLEEIIVLKNIEKYYITSSGNRFIVLDQISLEFTRKRFYSIIGISGSGKTTLLNIISGINNQNSGDLMVKTGRGLGYVFQENSILPWKTVYKNISFPMEISKKVTNINDEVQKICDLVSLDFNVHANKYPSQLSGGERRKVAIAMALAQDIDILLLDEPTSQLDFINKAIIHSLLRKVHNEIELTTIMVTHDLDEALFLSDEIIILRNNQIADSIVINYNGDRTYDDLTSKYFLEIRNRIKNNYI